MSESDDNKAIIRRFFAAAEAGEDILTFLDDDATWWVPGHWALGGTYRKNELAPLFDKVYAVLDGPLRFTIHAITAEEDRVAVDCESHGRFIDGSPFNSTYHFLMRLRGGRIISGKEFLNTAYMNAVLDRIAAMAV